MPATRRCTENPFRASSSVSHALAFVSFNPSSGFAWMRNARSCHGAASSVTLQRNVALVVAGTLLRFPACELGIQPEYLGDRAPRLDLAFARELPLEVLVGDAGDACRVGLWHDHDTVRIAADN